MPQKKINKNNKETAYTIIGKTADLTVVQQTVTDTLHRKGKTENVTAKEAVCSKSAVSSHIKGMLSGRKRRGGKSYISNKYKEEWGKKAYSRSWGVFHKM